MPFINICHLPSPSLRLAACPLEHQVLQQVDLSYVHIKAFRTDSHLLSGKERDREKKETPQTVPGSEEKGSYVCQCIDLAWILYVLIPLGICEKHSGLFLHAV